MKAKDELIKIIDEEIEEYKKQNNLENDIDIELLKETLKSTILKEKTSSEDDKFVSENLELYRRLIKSLLNYNENEIKAVLLEMAKVKNSELLGE